MADHCGVCQTTDSVTSKVSVSIPGVAIPMCGPCRGTDVEPWDMVVFVTAVGLSPQVVEYWRHHVSNEWAQIVDATIERYQLDENAFINALWAELGTQMPD